MKSGKIGFLLALPAFLMTAPRVSGDIFHLATGGRLEGVLLEDSGDRYQVMTPLGVVSVSRDSVVRIETTPSPLSEYRRRAGAVADTPADQAALGAWCEEQGLTYLSGKHYRRALELDPEFAPARRALGYVRVGDLWVAANRRGRVRTDDASEKKEEDPVKVARAIQGTWRRRIQAIKSMWLDSPLPHQVEEGRARILEIDDPLAVVPLAEVLSGGSLICREVLVEALKGFQEDAATVNLAALALLDSHRDIRQAALAELVRRKDPRVAGRFREALKSDNDLLIRRAAEALGALGVKEAVPDLIPLLRARRLREVEVPLDRYISTLPTAFPVQYCWVGSTMVALSPSVGVLSARPAQVVPAPFGPGRPRKVVAEVTLYRTEVREALRRLTGVDFGFDQQQWQRWYEEHRS